MNDIRYDVTTPEGIRQRDAETSRRRVPPAYRDAAATDPAVIAWCMGFAEGSETSLLITGPTGVGKTWQAYGAVRRLAETCAAEWLATTMPDLYARLRPSPDGDPEGEFARWASVPLLLLDDIGSAKGSAWTEEVDYRLVNHRTAYLLPAIYTTNLPVRGRNVPSLETALSERVFSRLARCQVVVLKGGDRRRKP